MQVLKWLIISKSKNLGFVHLKFNTSIGLKKDPGKEYRSMKIV